jgi:hypothetical protein
MSNDLAMNFEEIENSETKISSPIVNELTK